MKTRHAIRAISVFAAVLSMTGQALANDDFPSRTIRIVVPFQPGSAPDSNSRFIGQRLSEVLKQPVIIENKGGAGGMIGGDVIAKAAPDGYTVGYLSNQHLVHPYMMKKMPYDSVADFRAVSLVGQSPQVLLVPVTSKAADLTEFIRDGRSRKEPMMFGSGGIGSPAHVAGQLFARHAGVNVTHVPYKSSPESINALLSGEIDYIVTTSATAAPLVKSGKVKALALTSAQRQAAYPGLPTLAESLPDGPVYEPWGIFVVPAKTPQPVVDKLNKAFVQILKEKRTIDYFDSFGSRLTTVSPREADEFYRGEAARLESWVKYLDLKRD